MMTFGWIPAQSCFQPVESESYVGPTAALTTDQQVVQQATAQEAGLPTPGCTHPTWWYSLVALAAIAGIASRGHR